MTVCWPVRRFAVAVAIASAAAGAAPPPAHHVDLARWAWATPADERVARRDLDAARDSLEEAVRAAPASGERLLGILRLADRTRALTRTHGDYFHVRAAMDTHDEASARAEDSLATATDQAFEALRSMLSGVDERSLAALFAREPRLAPYRAFVEESRRRSARPLAPEAAALAALATSWQFRQYQRLVERTDFGTVTGPDGPLDVRRQARAIQTSPDSALRDQAMAKVAAGYASQRDLYALTLLQAVRAQNGVARARGFSDAPTLVYDSRQVTPAEVRALIAAVRPWGRLFRRYEAALSRSRSALRGARPPQLSLEATRTAMRAALSPLGPELARELETMLDPASGRLELGPGEHRQAGGFSFALPAGTHGVYLESFGGLPAEVSRLVHESGHALHYTIFESGGAPRVYRPAFPEAVAQFGEVLVADHLARTASSAADALYWRQLLLLKSLEVFLGARDAELEQALYDGVDSLGTADALDRLTARVDSAYTSDRSPAAAGRWMRVGLLYEDPLYLSNYLYSGALIAAFQRLYVADPAGFVSRYSAFMRESSAAPPREMLRRTLGLALDDPEQLAGSMRALESQIAAFEVDVARFDSARAGTRGGD
jgi:oligoendopeptidase F